jgi:glycosyltransferase involved in cell wall biosynthesis
LDIARASFRKRYSQTIIGQGLRGSMKILHVVQSLKGGPASYFDETIPDQVARYGRENVALVVPAGDLQYLSDQTKTAQMYAFTSRMRNLKSLLDFYVAFRNAMQVFKPDIVHLHSSYAGAICRLALLFSRHSPKVIYCSHGWAFDRGDISADGLKKKVIAGIERVLAWRTDLIINISQADQNSALSYGIGKDKSVVVRNGISEFDPPSEPIHVRQERLGMDVSKINVLFVGRFDRQKGFDLVLDAFQQLDPERYHLHAIGDFVVSNVRSKNNDLGELARNVSLLGWKDRSELPPYFAAADVVVMPSRWEGFGLVAAEAMRMQTPVLATSVGALPELVVDKVCGRLISGSSVAELVEVLREENKTTWREYGYRARLHFLENFTSTRLNTALAKLYAQLRQGVQKMDMSFDH